MCNTDPILPEYTPLVCRSLSEINECFRLRYEEYCVARKWEDPFRFPDGLEKDEYDDNAVHILLHDEETGAPVGTTRIIYHDITDDSVRTLPSFEWSTGFKEHLASSLQSASLVELSRFTIAQKRARPICRKDLAQGVSPALALVKGVLRATAKDNVDVVVMTLAESLRRLFARAGIVFHDIGIRLEHRGLRTPVYRRVSNLLEDVYRHNPSIWSYLTGDGEVWPLPGRGDLNTDATRRQLAF